MSNTKKRVIISIIFIAVIALTTCILVACVNNSENEKLFNAIENNDVDSAKKAIENGADVNCYKHTFSLIHWLGESVNPTPLWQACYKSNADMVKMLVENGADVSKVEKISKTTPLRATFITIGKDDRFEIAKYLIDNGASLGNEQEVIEYILQGSLENEDNNSIAIELLKELTKKGVDLNAIGEKNALTYSTRYGNLDAIEFLLENSYCQINSRNKDEETALIVAVQKNEIELVEKLLCFGANVSLKDSQGKTALDYATEQDNNDLISILNTAKTEDGGLS